MSEQLLTDVHNALWRATADVSGSDRVNPADLLGELAKLGYALVKLPEIAVDEWGTAR